MFADSSGEEIVMQALRDNDHKGNDDCSECKLERNSLDYSGTF